ncbi:hypothetical protein [Alkalihalophilus marmarensis]|uniref:hypothetical protein n=1 Tax=Alkalihalophilus marmarensis TaxID=521377 RepID=UPI002DB73307|nr:hypothetical protein [Alkalihalophilus marmarensis]MEC2074170.1 hypothetical protein [Alkalihalophilus marmarensis]
MSTRKKVIVATPDIEFAEAFKRHLQKNNVDVVDIASYLEMLIETVESNDVDAVIFTSNLAKKLNDTRLELLVDTIYSIRQAFPKVKFIVYSNEPAGHPFLTELVSLGIYNIFLKDDRSKGKNSISSLIELIEYPKEFAEVSHLLQVDKSFKWRKDIDSRDFNLIDIQRSQGTPEIEVKEGPKQEEKNAEIPKVKQAKVKQPKVVKVIEYNAPEINENELLEDLEMEQKVQIIRERTIVGTGIISVAGFESNTGCTSLAILLANYLSKSDHQVALVERTSKQSFNRIEYAYEGKRGFQSKKKLFDIQGVDYYKYDLSLNISDLINTYHYIILDHGCFKETKFMDEIERSNVKIMTAHGAEWKHEDIRQYYEEQKGKDKGWIWALPFAEKEAATDIQSDIEGIDIEPIPYHPDPYVLTPQVNKVLDALLLDFAPVNEGIPKRLTWAIGIVMILSLALILGTYFLI